MAAAGELCALAARRGTRGERPNLLRPLAATSPPRARCSAGRDRKEPRRSKPWWLSSAPKHLRRPRVLRCSGHFKRRRRRGPRPAQRSNFGAQTRRSAQRLLFLQYCAGDSAERPESGDRELRPPSPSAFGGPPETGPKQLLPPLRGVQREERGMACLEKGPRAKSCRGDLRIGKSKTLVGTNRRSCCGLPKFRNQLLTAYRLDSLPYPASSGGAFSSLNLLNLVHFSKEEITNFFAINVFCA